MSLPPLPPYVYGREVAPNEKVWTESAVRELLAEGVRAGLELAAQVCLGVKDKTGWNEPTAYSSGGGWIQRARPYDCAAAIRAEATKQTSPAPAATGQDGAK